MLLLLPLVLVEAVSLLESLVVSYVIRCGHIEKPMLFDITVAAILTMLGCYSEGYFEENQLLERSSSLSPVDN